jgi:hypothetical protein
LKITSVVCSGSPNINQVTVSWTLTDPNASAYSFTLNTQILNSSGTGVRQVNPVGKVYSKTYSYTWGASSVDYQFTLTGSASGLPSYTTSLSGTCPPNYTGATPSPTPTPTPTPSCTPQCSVKEIGDIGSIGNTFNATTTLTQGSQYWVRLTATGANTTSNITLKENINQSNFRIVNPTVGTTFRILGSGNTDLTNTACPDNTPADGIPDCISNIQKDSSNRITGMDIQLGSVSPGTPKYVLFKATVLSQGTNVKVDNISSTIEYTTLGWTQALDSGPDVTIGAPSPYFQLSSGNMYSEGSISTQLPSGSYFTSDNQALLMHNGTANYGSGSGSVAGLDIANYSISNTSVYNKYYTLYNKYLTSIDLSSLNNLSATSGYYINASPGDLVIQNIPTALKTVTNTNYVIFVNGNLFIRDNFTITKNGNESVVFIVSGNIGIDPSITKVEGVYLADGIIDTSCSGNSFDVNNKCSPNTGDTSGGSTLTLDGLFFAHGGFSLDRYATPGSTPGEIFSARPDLVLATTPSLGQKVYSWKENKQ